MSYFWLISAPAEPTKDATWNTLQRKTAKESNLSLNYKFDAPSLRVGTLDSLMSLSDELLKVDMQVEATVRKIERQLNELQQKNERPLVDRKPVESYVTGFQWDAAKYPVQASVKDLVEQIMEEINVLEEEIKQKAQDYHQTRSSLTAMEKKQSGTLMTKNIDTLVKKDDFVESEHLTTLLVVVPRFAQQQWLDTYESLTQFIVPRSSKKVAEDSEYTMFTITLFRRVVDNFKNACREHRFTVRDFTYDAQTIATNAEDRRSLKTGAEKQWSDLVRWCSVNYGEAFSCWIHVKAIRVFVESVLRYGLPANFVAALVKPTSKRNEKKVLDALNQLYGYLGVGGSEPISHDSDFFPFVYLPIHIDEVNQRL